MDKAKPSELADSFMFVETVHQGSVQFWWADGYLHDTDYNLSVKESMYAKAKALAEQYDVSIDTRFCCQWEGLQFLGSNLAQVEAATRALACHLGRFKGIIPLQD